MKEALKEKLSKMTLEEKASLCSGLDFWHLKGIGRLDIQPIMVTDGPHGLRKAKEGTVFENQAATCFPTASATACSWDRELLREVGQAMGEECLQEDVAVILGPGTNIKRSPLCGRNFEYFSEDPVLAGEMAASLIKGVQSQGVGTSLKHYAVNNQETRRMTINAVVDQRALREIYLAAFEIAVKQSQPWTVMNAYNRLNGIYCSENEWLLTRVLRDEWGFEGLVMTDWGANNDRVAGLKAGQDLEMPGTGGVNDAKIVAAVKAGQLDEAVLDRAVLRLLDLIDKSSEKRKPGYRYDSAAHHALARRAAANSMVLLKNEDNLLPLDKTRKVAVVGDFACHPRYQGAGSSSMNPTFLDNAADELGKAGLQFTYAAGYQKNAELPDAALIDAACAAAKAAEVVLVFAGLPDTYEVESADREHIRLPESHNQLIKQVAAANPNTVVVLSNGAPVEMPWLGEVKAVLEGYLGGQAGAGAAVDILLGVVNPSGKLAETFPQQLDDVLASRYFPAGPKTVEYRESLYVGYRYFDSAKKPVRFPFGYGLSYTTFEYSALKLSAKQVSDRDTLTVSLKVKNTGSTAGAETVQLYVCDNESTVFRPEKELKGFDKIFLKAGEEKEVQIQLDSRAFAFYNTEIGDWMVESGDFDILVGASSRDIRLKDTVRVESSRINVPLADLRKTAPVYYHIGSANQGIDDAAFQALYRDRLPINHRVPGELYNTNTPLGDMKHTFVGGRLYAMVLSNISKMFGEDETMRIMAVKMVGDLPLRNMVMMSNGQFSQSMVDAILMMVNGKFFTGLYALVKEMLSKKK
jgi:beta-glucosidase